jgi:hypothetical protein
MKIESSTRYAVARWSVGSQTASFGISSPICWRGGINLYVPVFQALGRSAYDITTAHAHAVAVDLIRAGRAGAGTRRTRSGSHVDAVDLDRYVGDWFEVARFPNRFQRQCASDVGPATQKDPTSHRRHQSVFGWKMVVLPRRKGSPGWSTTARSRS